MTGIHESEVFSRPNDQAISYQLNQFDMWGNTPGKQGSRFHLVFGERNGAPRISVFTGLDNPKFLWIGFDPLTFEMFLAKLEQVAKSKDPVADFIQNMEKAKDSKEYTVRNTLHFGKSDDGIVYIEIEEKGLKFPVKFELPVWHKFYRVSDGQPMSASEFSALRAISLANVLRRVYGNWSSRIMPVNKDGWKKQPATKPSQATPSTFNDSDFAY